MLPATQVNANPSTPLAAQDASPPSAYTTRPGTPSLWPDFMVGQPGQPVRVLLVDDDAHIRKIIANELLNDLRTDIVAQGGSLREGRHLIAQHAFDVMLVDLNLGDGNGFDLIKYMKVLHPNAEAVVISVLEDEQQALHAFELGATGYLVKNSWFGNFPEAVLQVVNGGASITPSLARRLLRKLQSSAEGVSSSEHGHQKDQLSEREKCVLTMITAGYTSIEISSKLNISAETVNTHIKHIYGKLHVHNRAQAVSSAAHRGLI